ncbi:MAG: ribosome maturation factor RimP [Acidimicrobiales bacterium]
MAQETAETLYGALAPVIAALDLELELVDVELSASTVRVTVDRDGGIDLDALAAVNRAVSDALDDVDPVPGRYTLEVSSPGLERRLRTPAHFANAVGEVVSVRLIPGTGDARRLQGIVTGADAHAVSLEGPEVPDGAATVAYDTIDRARTVFEWGAKPAPSPSRAKGHKAREKAKTP